MRIVHTFSNQLHTAYTDFDILIWQASLIKLKEFSYKVVMYCASEDDINFLKAHKLFNYYDEINSTYFNNSYVQDFILKDINETNFWSLRKLIALGYDMYTHQSEQVVYLDTDIVLFKPLVIDKDVDLYTWSTIPSNVLTNKVELTDLSIPPDYEITPDIAENHLSYNCGLLYFKGEEQQSYAINNYIGYAKNNPCIVLNYIPELDYSTLSWAQIAEQRILYGLAKTLNWNVLTYQADESWLDCHTTDSAVHYCYLRAILANRYKHDEIPDKWKAIYNRHYALLSDIVNNAL